MAEIKSIHEPSKTLEIDLSTESENSEKTTVFHNAVESVKLIPMEKSHPNYFWMPEKTVTLPWYHRIFGDKTKKYPSGWYLHGNYRYYDADYYRFSPYSTLGFISDDAIKYNPKYKNHIAIPGDGIYLRPHVCIRTITGNLIYGYHDTYEEALEQYLEFCSERK